MALKPGGFIAARGRLQPTPQEWNRRGSTLTVPAMGTGIDWFNALPEDTARAALRACCASPLWVAQLVGLRPYPDEKSLSAWATQVLCTVPESEIDAALAEHPRIGERTDNPDSSREQAGVQTADADVISALLAGNNAYEAKFGRVYLVCASGRTGPELLALLHRRLEHDAATERLVTRDELGKITALRLARLLAERSFERP